MQLYLLRTFNPLCFLLSLLICSRQGHLPTSIEHWLVYAYIRCDSLRLAYARCICIEYMPHNPCRPPSLAIISNSNVYVSLRA
ncbi:MAG: hypothetical protein J3R72DRAFT_43853 [Linnemannia gamsii]|nr:MAG: hypothetical protein J3R72DRAFT_43853 [Linnemannia gamsii]